MPFHELVPEREKGPSEKASLHDNLIVHGDSLAALKSRYRHPLGGRVRRVYDLAPASFREHPEG